MGTKEQLKILFKPVCRQNPLGLIGIKKAVDVKHFLLALVVPLLIYSNGALADKKMTRSTTADAYYMKELCFLLQDIKMVTLTFLPLRVLRLKRLAFGTLWQTSLIPNVILVVI